MNGGDSSNRDANGNIGIGNQGHNNIGNYNIGDNNVGDRNNGNGNVGNFNNGNNNHGSFNNGNDNWGNSNVGNHITGNNVIQTANPLSNAGTATQDTQSAATNSIQSVTNSIQTATNSIDSSSSIIGAGLNTASPTPGSSGNSLSAGLLAAIIIPIVLIVLLIIACCIWVSKRRNQEATPVKKETGYSHQILVSPIPPAVSLPSASEHGLGTAIAKEYQNIEYGTGLATGKALNQETAYQNVAVVDTEIHEEAPRYLVTGRDAGAMSASAAVAAYSDEDEKVVAYNTDTLSSHHSGAAKKVEYEEYTLPRIPSQAASLGHSSPLVYDQELQDKNSFENMNSQQNIPPPVQLDSGLAGATVFTGLAALAAAVGITSSNKKQEESAVISDLDTQSFADTKIEKTAKEAELSQVNVLKKVEIDEKVIGTGKHNTLEEAEGFASAAHQDQNDHFEEIERKVIKEEIVVKKLKEVKFEQKKVDAREVDIPIVNTGDIKTQLAAAEEESSTAVSVDRLPERIQIQKQMYTRKDDKYFVPDDDEPEDLDDWAPPAATSHVVFTSYFPKQRDEMRLQPGDLIGIEKEYGDGWARGQNISQGRKRCIFPLAILTPIKSGPTQNVRKGKGIVWQGQANSSAQVKENAVYQERTISLRRLGGKNRSRTSLISTTSSDDLEVK
ncbi:hypothetical protein HDV01_005395 [Terramyces sp. JEL0728]|nr:hypothetical protein HDV01_005395 [Terramyces sp. JEL0728]